MTDSPPTVSVDSRAQSTSKKKIVMCLDGTGNQIGSHAATNAAKIFQMLELTHPESQIAYYDPGVGTLPASTARSYVGRTASQVAQLAFGFGMRTNLTQAYTWLMQQYQPGDELFLFGFSRGAYTARALVGMLARPGLLRPGSDNLVDYALKRYAINHDPSAKEKRGLCEFADAFCWGTEKSPLMPAPDDPEFHTNWHAVPVHYLGVWDTVEASGFLGMGTIRWPGTRSLSNAESIRHAVSIDERRRPYHEFLVGRAESHEEVWFAGVHSDVGGTFDDKAPDRHTLNVLSTIALKWVVDPVVGRLALRDGAYARACAADKLDYKARIHKMGLWWRLTGTRRRPIPMGAGLHASVQLRQQWDPGYRPHVDGQPLWVDPDWERAAV